MANIVCSEEFIANLDNWLFKNDQKNATYIKTNKEKIPAMFRKSSLALYRGMTVDEEFLRSIDKNPINFDKITSWTKDEKVAIKFTSDDKFKFTKTKGYRILIKKRIPEIKILFDIHGFVMFMGNPQLEMLGMDELNLDSAWKEQEVLVDSGIKITKSDVKLLDKI